MYSLRTSRGAAAVLAQSADGRDSLTISLWIVVSRPQGREIPRVTIGDIAGQKRFRRLLVELGSQRAPTLLSARDEDHRIFAHLHPGDEK